MEYLPWKGGNLPPTPSARGGSGLNKAELVDAVAAKSNLSKKDAAGAVDALLASIEEALARGEKVQIVGFGSFEVRERSARTGRNPQTGEEIEIGARKVPVFRPGKALRDSIMAT